MNLCSPRNEKMTEIFLQNTLGLAVTCVRLSSLSFAITTQDCAVIIEKVTAYLSL